MELAKIEQFERARLFKSTEFETKKFIFDESKYHELQVEKDLDIEKYFALIGKRVLIIMKV